ncbi:MAG TPA: hypothetical protein VK973_11650, partial [Arenicellales bacterium]|nr:hypothetical protein [Arenicellales bacterium]
LPLGIRKIDAGETAGRFEFTEQPQVDAARIVQLVQTAPENYRLEGVEKLRFNLDMPDADTRLESVARLLDEISPEAA